MSFTRRWRNSIVRLQRTVPGVLAVMLLAAAIGISPAAAAEENAELDGLLKTLQAVGREGKGHREAMAAWEQVVRADAKQLPTILAALDGAEPLAANWIRGAIDTIAERELQRGGTLPADALEQFVLEREHAPRGRRLAYEWLSRVDPSAADRLIPQMLDDPSVELRRDAVERRLKEAERLRDADQKEAATKVYREALSAARDLDQVRLAHGELKKLGVEVPLAEHFGFLLNWKLIGPFDNTGKKGFAIAYPPEKSVDLNASYQGKEKAVRWIDHTTNDEYGQVDLNQALEKHNGAVGYGYAVFMSDRQRDVELRLGSTNAIKIWLNGELLCQAEVYHANVTMDQYIGRGTLKPGQNEILVKICQNEQTEDWAQDWKFQLRVCDAVGSAVLSQDRPQAEDRVSKRNADGTGAQP